jgi:hypothetical protein
MFVATCISVAFDNTKVPVPALVKETGPGNNSERIPAALPVVLEVMVRAVDPRSTALENSKFCEPLIVKFWFSTIALATAFAPERSVVAGEGNCSSGGRDCIANRQRSDSKSRFITKRDRTAEDLESSLERICRIQDNCTRPKIVADNPPCR